MVILNDDDKLTLARFSDLEELCKKKKTPQFSQFLDPKEVMLFKKVYRPSAFVNTEVFGGFEDSERKIAGFFPDFLEADEREFPISVIKIEGAEEKSHRDFLGSLMGLGIKRSSVGDIVTADENAYVFVTDVICDYILLNLSKIGRQKVKLTKLLPEEVTISPKEFEEVFVTCASLRLDAVISTAMHFSRSKALELIERELVSVNWQVQKSPSKEVKEGDSLTVRGYGRFMVGEILGETKKGRLKIQLKKDK